MPSPPLLLKVIIFADLVYLTVVGAAIAAYFVYNALFAHYPQLMYCIVDISVLILPLNVLVLFKGYQQLQVANQLQLQLQLQLNQLQQQQPFQQQGQIVADAG